jgi:hypothetical protein
LAKICKLLLRIKIILSNRSPRSASHFSQNKIEDKDNNMVTYSAPTTPINETIDEMMPLRNFESLPVIGFTEEESIEISELEEEKNKAEEKTKKQSNIEPPMLCVQAATPLHKRRASLADFVTLKKRPSLVSQNINTFAKLF